MAKEFKIKVLTKPDKNALDDLNKLLPQWKKGYQISSGYFKKFIKESHLITVCRKNRVIGIVTLVKIHKISGVKGAIEHLILDEKYRGRGLGKKLMGCAVSLAKKLKIETLLLTCEPERKAANALYKKLGFKIKKTNYYYLDI